MASFADIKAKMNKNYGDAKDEDKKKQKEQQPQSGAATSTSKFSSIRSEMDGKYKPTYSHVDDSFISTFMSDASKFFTQMETERAGLDWKSGTNQSKANTRRSTWNDLSTRASAIRKYADANKGSMGTEAYNELISYLDGVTSTGSSVIYDFYKKGRYYSQWDSEDAYIKGAAENWQQRQKRYENNEKRIEALKAERKEVDPGIAHPAARTAAKNLHGDRLSEIDAEIAALEAENLKYKRGEGGWVAKVVDDNYSVTQRADFATTSANRDYKNPTQDEYAQIAAYNDQNKWYFDENGVYRDAYGNELEVDEFGNWVNPQNKDYTIKDKLGLFLNATEEHRNKAAAGNWGINNVSETFREGLDGDWKYLTDTEIGIYYTYLGESQEKAYQYLADMETELDRRRTLDEIGQWEKKYEEASGIEKIGMSLSTTPAQLLSGIGGSISNAISTAKGEEINPYSTAHSGMHYSQTVRGARAEEFSDTKILGDFFTAGDLYQAGMSIGDSFLAIGLGGAAGGVVLASSAAQSEAYRLYQQGASSEQIAFGSTAAFAAEMIFESFSIGELNKIKNMASPKTLMQFVKTALVQGGVEASEEIATEIANIVSNAIIMASQSDFSASLEENNGDLGKTLWDKTMDVLHAGLSGLVSGVGSGGVYGAVPYARQQSQFRQTGRTIKAADGGVNALQDLTNKVAGASEGRMQRSLTRQAGNLSQNTSDAKVGYLYDTVQTANKVANTSANQADIAKSLERKGFNSETANDIASALVARYNGQSLTKAQESLLKSVENSKVVKDAISNIVTNEQSTLGQRQQNIREFQNAVKDGIFASASGLTVETYKNMVKSAQLHQETKTEAPAVESNYKVSADGNAYDSKGNAINIVGVDSVKDGKLILKTENGTIDSSEVEYATGSDALIYEAVAQTGATPASAWAMINGFKESDGVSAQDYARDISLAYKYGKLNFKSGLQALDLTSKQKNEAFQMGRDDAAAAVNPTTQASTESTTSEKNAGKEIIFEGFTYSKRKANPAQRASMEAIDVINKMSNLEVHVYKSYKKDGKLYAMVNGKERLAHNGYFTDGNKIYIDFNAGNKGEGLMLYTLSHEVGHYIAEWNAQDFKAISDFLFDHYGEDVPIYDLLEEQKNKLKESYKRDGKEVPGEAQLEKLAHEELVCDMLSRMLADKNAYDKLMDLKQKDLNVFQKLGQAIKEALDKLSKILGIYDTLNPDAKYTASVENFGEEAFRQLQDLYMRAFVQADANFQAAEKNTTEDGGVNIEDDIKLSPREESAFKQFSRAINSVINQAIAGKGNIDGKVQVKDIMPVGPRLVAMVAESSGNAIDLSSRSIALNTSDVWHEYKRHTSVTEETSRGQVAFTKRQFQNAVKSMISPDLVETIFADTNNPTQRQSFAYAKKTKRGHYVVVEAVGGKKNPNITPVMIVQFSKAKWNKMMAEGKSLGEMLHEGDTQKLLAQDIEKNKKSRVTAAQFASYEAIANTLRSPQLDDMVSQPKPEVKNESTEALDMEVDAKTESVAPSVMNSERTWTESDYVQEREQAAKEISKAIGVSVRKAKAYIDSVNSIAKMIAEDRVRLDYFSSPGRSSFVGNVEYGGSFDFSTLCKKRRLLTGTFTAIQKALPNTALTANEILDIRNRMKDAGLEVSCGLCYVEGSIANMGQFAKEFLRLYKQYYPDAWQPNMADVNTPDGIEWVRINHPECYEQYEYFWNHYGTLKPGDKNLFASQQKPKLYQLHTEYKGEILDKFKDDDSDTVEDKNLNGGIRLQSFSDFEIVHLIDTMQIIMDMSRVGLAGQAYTKVPDFAWALGDTGLKINLSLIAKGVDANGKLIFDDVEGMPIDTAVALRDRYSKNVGTILVAFNDEQLLAAMADDRVDFIIPFHRSQWKKSQYEAMGLPAKTKDYTYMQNEKFIKPQFHEYRGRMVKDKATNYMPNEYWDFSKSGKENAEDYLEMCARNNKRPKFYKLLQNNGDGSYSLKADGSTDGYWKLLIDFKMYDNSGKGSPQMPVKPDFNMAEATRMLDEYQGGHSNFPVAQGIVDEFVKEYKDSHKDTVYSDRDSTYLDAVNRGDMETVQKMVDEAAKKSGYTTKGYHGTSFKFTSFNTDIIYFSANKNHAKEYGKNILGLYVKADNPYISKDGVVADKNGTPFMLDGEEVTVGWLDEAPDALDYLISNGYDAAWDEDMEYAAVFYAENAKSADPVTYDDDGNVIPLSQRFNQANDDIRYSERTEDSISNRSLLANAFEGVAQNEIEKNKIQEYKSKIDLINSEERKLQELTEQIKDLSFAKGPRDTKKIRSLQFEANQTANRISVYDKQLLRLEASKPLQDVLNREKKIAYKRAEQKGKDALAAYKEKTAKTQRELLDRWQDSRKKGIESRHKTAMRHKIKNIVNELNQYLLRGTKDRHVPIELQKAVAEALDAVNMDTVGAEERIAKLKAELLKAKTPEQIQEISRKIDHVEQMGDRMNGRLQKLKDAYDQFVNSDDPLIANSHDEVISNKLQSVIEEIGNTPLRDMSLTQLEDVYDMYRMVLTTIRNANKAFKAKKSESISTIANRVMMEVEQVGGKKKLSMKAMEGVKDFFWNNLKPVYAFEHIGSSAFTEVFNNVRAGEDVWAVDVTEAREYYLDKSKKHNYNSWDFDKQFKFTSTSGMDFNLNLEQIMSLYAYSKRDQAADHLKKGGIVIDETTEVTIKTKLGIPVKFNPTEATAYNISEETLSDIVSKLTDEQKAFVDEMQDYLSTVMGAKGNEVSLEMYGIKLFKEKFYFPLKSAQQFMAKAKEQQQGESKIKNSGFSKETVQKASNPIVLTPFMNVWANHVNEMSMYHAFVLPMEDFYRVYNYKTPTSETLATESVEMFIQNAYGKGATKYIDQLLKDLNGGARTDSTTGFINKMIGLFKKGAVFASLSVVVQQPSAIARATALVDTKYFIGPKVDHKRHEALWDEVKQYAPVAIIKEMGYFDTSVGKSTQDFILGQEYSGFTEKMKALVTDGDYRDELLSKAPALADEIAWCGIWEAVKRELKAKNPSVDIKSEEFLKMAGERFTEVIVRTQVYDSVLSRSGFMRSKDTGMKMATSFMAEPTTSINMIADAILQGKRGNKKYARTAVGAVIASQILNSILVSFVYAGRDDDEDETYIEKYIGTFSGQALDSLNPAAYIPFIKDIVSIVQGYDVERSDMSVISDLWKAWENLSNDNVSTYRKVEGFASSIAQIFGLPLKNIMRDVRGIYQTVDSFVNGQQTTGAGIGYAIKGAITGKTDTNQQQLYEAYLSGDEAHIARVEGRFDDQTQINNAIRKALRENDSRIHDAAVARNNGNISEYTRIAKEIIAEKHFSQDNVVAAINAEINALNKGETTTSAPKASGFYKAEDFATAISQGDAAMANAIKVDIIQTAQKNGKSEEEAEKNFRSSAASSLKELFLSGDVSESQAVNALETYCDKTEDAAMADVQYWAFKQEHPDVYADDQWFDTYYEKIVDSGLAIDVYMEYRNKVSTITGEGKKENRMSVINSLPITSAQKDALYLAEGWAESKLYEAPWH